jgi:elongation factor P
MGVRATEVRKGTVFEKDGDLLVIMEYVHKTPGNLRAIIHIKAKSLKTGQTNVMRLGSSDVLEVAYLDKKKAEYLYKESNGDFVFMDSETFDQFTLPPELVAEKMGFVKENTTVEVTFTEKTPIGVDLPSSVVLEVKESESAVKGNTATNVKKDAILETGLSIKVPLHISVGDKVKVNTENGDFLGRVKE